MSREAPTPACEKCKLWKTCNFPLMEPDITSDNVDVLLVGEAPGRTEDNKDVGGKPFIGESGQLLRAVVDDVGLSQRVAYTNVVHCRPPDNKTPTTPQMKHCLPNLLGEIEQIDPTLVVLLGNIPLRALLGESGITSWHGILIEREDRAYFPVFHPAHILRNRNMLEQWVDDFDKMVDYLDGNIEQSDVSKGYDLRMVETADQAIEMHTALRYAGRCSWDTETNGLAYGAAIALMSFAVNTPDKVAWAVVMNDNTVSICRNILADPDVRKIGHNVKFDMLAATSVLGVDVKGIAGDSMLLSYVLDSVPGRHGLKSLAGRHLDMYGYSSRFETYCANHPEASPKRGGDIRKVPIGIIAPYAQLDAIATLELHQHQYMELTPEQRVLYDQLIVPVNEVFAEMEKNGTVIDEYIASRYIKIYTQVQEEHLETVKNDNEVKKYTEERRAGGTKKDLSFEFNPNSSYQVCDVLYGYVKCPKCGKNISWDNRKRTAFDCKKCGTRVKIPAQYRYNHYGLEPLMYTETGRPSAKWDAIKGYVDEIPMLPGYRYYRLLGKMLSTYLKPSIGKWVDVDGRVRSDYQIGGTVTGRPASRSPNLMNIPTPEKEPGTLLESLPIKNIFTHTWEGGCILVADFSGMELRTMASISQCIGMIEAFSSGVEIHSYVTEMLYHVRQEDYASSEWKSLRYRAKWVNWTLLFGGGWHTLVSLYGLSDKEAMDLEQAYYDMFPEVLEYKQDTLDFVRKHGYVESKFGRKRYMPYINDRNDGKRKKDERAAVNMPIQSVASDVMLCALVIILETMREYGFKSLMVNTVYDSVMFDVYPGELDDLAWLVAEIMENVVVKYGPERFPGFDFSWFTVPLVADLETGSHYGCVTSYKENDNVTKGL